MTTNKLEVAQKHIDSMDYRIEMHQKEIKSTIKSMQDYMEQGNYRWVDICAKKIREEYHELAIAEKTKKEMQDLLDFLSRPE
jgi:hypothetical protein